MIVTTSKYDYMCINVVLTGGKSTTMCANHFIGHLLWCGAHLIIIDLHT